MRENIKLIPPERRVRFRKSISAPIISRGMRPATAAGTWSQSQATASPKNVGLRSKGLPRVVCSSDVRVSRPSGHAVESPPDGRVRHLDCDHCRGDRVALACSHQRRHPIRPNTLPQKPRTIRPRTQHCYHSLQNRTRGLRSITRRRRCRRSGGQIEPLILRAFRRVKSQPRRIDQRPCRHGGKCVPSVTPTPRYFLL